jgi:hypothetical protein
MTADNGLFVDRDILNEIRNDAREARDGVLQLKAVMGEQNIPVKLAEFRAEMKANHTELRADVVHAIDRTRSEAKEADANLAANINRLADRIEPLEEDFHQRTGGAKALQILKDWGAFFVAAGGSVIAYVAAKGHP